jgi:hypothetical protein
LVYLRLLETNDLRTVPIATGGWDSRGYKDFREVAPELVVPDKSCGNPPWRSRSEASRLPGARRRDTFRPWR